MCNVCIDKTIKQNNMWNTKTFKTQEEAYSFMQKIKDRYIFNLILIENGYGVEYKPLTIIL